MQLDPDLGYRMRRALLLLALAGGIAGCATPVPPPSKETMLRELYFMEKALGPDTTTYGAFAADATADTAAWNLMYTSWKGTRAFFSATLGQLSYGTGPFTWKYGSREEAALSHFQHDLAIPVTGRLDSLTVSHLVRAENALKMADIKLQLLSVSRSGVHFFAAGTWKAITNKLYYPANTVNIECNAITGECSVATLDFISDALDQADRIRTQFLHVVHWDKDMLIAKSGDESDITLTINVPAQDVTYTQVSQAYPSGLLSTAPGAMTLRLVSGRELSPPFDGGDLKAEHDELFKDKERYLALRTKNMTVR